MSTARARRRPDQHLRDAPRRGARPRRSRSASTSTSTRPSTSSGTQRRGSTSGFEGHTHFVTVGQAIGSAGCAVPTCGLDWITTLPPVVLDHWPVAERVVHDALTTVGNWRGYGSIEHDGIHYGQKAHSLRRFIELRRSRTSGSPSRSRSIRTRRRTSTPSRRTAGSCSTRARWPARRPRTASSSRARRPSSASPRAVTSSRAAAGSATAAPATSRPAGRSIAQETGFSEFLPTGDGLLRIRDGRGRARGDRRAAPRLRPPRPRRARDRRGVPRLRSRPDPPPDRSRRRSRKAVDRRSTRRSRRSSPPRSTGSR